MTGMLAATAFTRMMSVPLPVALAPMGGVSGGALAAAVSAAGGLGLVGGARGHRDWLERELAIVTQRCAGAPWGIGFLTWAVDVATVEWALTWRPHAVLLSFGDPAPFADRVRAAGVPLIIQVTSLDEARQAAAAGADVIVAQGSEAGGHGGGRATLPFVPAVVDLVAPRPVLAAGGIADGRGLAAALVLGAAGALIGTRFQAADEALSAPEIRQALVTGQGGDTERTRVLDIAARAGWPPAYTARVLRNRFLEDWRGREAELAADTAAQDAYRAAARAHDLDAVSVWAGEGLDLITSLEPAAALVARIAREAETALRGAVPPA